MSGKWIICIQLITRELQWLNGQADGLSPFSLASVPVKTYTNHRSQEKNIQPKTS